MCTSSFNKLAWAVINSNTPPTETLRYYAEFNRKYAGFVSLLVYNLQLTPINLVIALYYLHRYQENSVIEHSKGELPESEDSVNSLDIYLIITALVLSNKSYDDQSYTLQTWVNIINNTAKQTSVPITGDLKLLNTLELYFLLSLDYKLSFASIGNCVEFWNIFATSPLSIKPHVVQNMMSTVTETSSPAPLPVTPPAPQTLVMAPPMAPPVAMQFAPAIPLVCQLPPLQTPLMSSPATFTSSVCLPLTPLTPSYEMHNYGYPFKRKRLYQGVLSKGYGNQMHVQLPLQYHTGTAMNNLMINGMATPTTGGFQAPEQHGYW